VESSLAVLSFTVGRMESYDNKWIMQEATACDDDQSSPATLGLTNMAGELFNSLTYKVLWV